MAEEGREEENKSDPLERMADALEKLASDPEIEIEMGPPICPNCGKLNPEIRVPPEDGSVGPMLEIVIHAVCLHCNTPLFVAIESFSVHRDIRTLTEEIEARRAGFSSE